MLRSLVAVAMLAMPSAVVAAPETWSCASTSDRYFSNYAAVDQIILDSEARTIDMRAASTMGTSQEVQYIFANRGTAADALTWQSGGPDDDIVVGTRFGQTFVFTRIGDEMGITTADKIPHTFEGWKCAR